MATNWVDEVLSGATSTGSKTLSLATGNALSVANSSSESIFTVTSDTTNGGYTSILGIEGQEAVLFLGADNADDAGDVWEIHSDTSGNFKIGNRTSGTGSPTRSNTFTNSLTIDSSRNITVGVDDIGYDVKFFGATSGSFLLWDESDDALELTDSSPLKIGDGADMQIYHDGSHSYITNATGTLKLATESSGIAVTIGHTTSVTTIADELDVTGTVDINDTTDASSKTTGALKVDGGVGIAKKLYVGTDLDVDGTTNLDAVDIDGAVQLDNTLTVGVSGTGYNVKLFGATANSYWLWDKTLNRVRQVGTGQNSFRIETSLADDNVGPGLHLYRNSSSPSGSSGDYDTIGAVSFLGTNATDGTDSEVAYGRIRTRITDATKDAEGGEVNIDAMGGGTLRNVIKGVGASGNDDMDVTIGSGATSLTKVAGYFAANSATPAAAPNYTVSNLSTDRALDCDSTSDAEVADVLGQVITDLIAIGIFQ